MLIFLAPVARASHYTEGERVWKEFRAAFPYPFRTIACEETGNGCRTYILSEPPEHVELECIHRIFDGFVHKVQIKSTPIGYDGQLRDVVIFTDGIPEPAHHSIVAELNRLVYGTVHKAHCLRLPYTGKAPHDFFDEDYSLRVNDRFLYELTLGSKSRLTDLQTGTEMPLAEIVARSAAGVFDNPADDIVILALRLREDVSDRSELFHIFAVESDILLGAVNSDDMVMVVGRRRKNDFVTMPPLRTDEILMLAAAGDDTIGQSLDICSPVFSKVKDGYDWCPAWVSGDIRDSEYACLLTATDQYLKFWLKYDDYDLWGFSNARPGLRFDKSILAGKPSLTYNWNTTDYAYGTSYDKGIVCHFNNIGCLNCKLVENETGNTQDDINSLAFEYLRSSRSPEIFRVAQYTMLYEIFRLFGITAYRWKRSLPESGLPFLPDATAILTRLRELSDMEIDNIASTIYSNEIVPQFSRFTDDDKVSFVKDDPYFMKEAEEWEQSLENVINEQARNAGITPEQYKTSDEYKILRRKVDDRLADIGLTCFDYNRIRLEERFCMDVIESIEASRDRLRSLTADQFDNFCRYCASPAEYDETDWKYMKSLEGSLSCRFLLSNYSCYFGYDIDRMMQRYVDSHEKDGKRWLKAPSVVLCRNKENYAVLRESFGLKQRRVIGGYSVLPAVSQTAPSVTKEGDRIMCLTGNPVEDSWFYSRKAAGASSHHEMIRYIRQAREAMSQSIRPDQGLKDYTALSEKVEAGLKSALAEYQRHHALRTELANDFNELARMADLELNDSGMTEEKRESYRFVKDIAVREAVRLSDSEPDADSRESRRQHSDDSKTISEPSSSESGQTEKEMDGSALIPNRNNSPAHMTRNDAGRDNIGKTEDTEIVEEIETAEDDEIRALRQRLRNLQLTLMELKRGQHGAQ